MPICKEKERKKKKRGTKNSEMFLCVPSVPAKQKVNVLVIEMASYS